ncbi:MAG: DUF2726 domain-containing protein [Pseudomonadota bacterium]
MVDQFLATPWFTAVLVLTFALLAYGVLHFPVRRRRKPRRPAARTSAAEAKAALDTIERVGFERYPLLSRDEARVFDLLVAEVAALSSDYRVMAQISLTEVIGPDPDNGTKEDRDDARRFLGEKRLDFGVFDGNHNLRVAILSQRPGYAGKREPDRDPVITEALRKAGVPVMGIKPGARPAQVAAVLARYIRAKPTGSPRLVAKR